MAQKNQLQIEVHQEISNVVVDVLEVRVVVVKLVVDAVVVEEMDAVPVESVDVVLVVEDNQEHLQIHGKMNQTSLKTQQI